MQTAMMMTMMHDDDDDGDHVVEQDGLSMVQTRSWPMEYHLLHAGAQVLHQSGHGWEAPAPAVRLQRVFAADPSQLPQRVGEALAIRGVCGRRGCCYDGENDDVDDDVMAMTRVTTMAMTWVTTMAH